MASLICSVTIIAGSLESNNPFILATVETFQQVVGKNQYFM